MKNVDARYQVFISSTYSDLREERQKVSKAILELGHFPSGMELFPSDDSDQFEFIKGVIQECDYYVLILGGRYGSLSNDGLSFTEKEFDYAKSLGLPICAHVHKNTDQLISKNVDLDDDLRVKLNLFKEKVQSAMMVKFWETSDELTSNVILSFSHLMRTQPRIGWRRGDVVSVAQTERIAQLQESNLGLRKLVEEMHEQLAVEEIDLTRASIEVQFSSVNSGLVSESFSASKFLRFCAGRLYEGLDISDLGPVLEEFVVASTSYKKIDVHRDSIKNVGFFLELFSIVQRHGDREIKLNPKSLHSIRTLFIEPAPTESRSSSFKNDLNDEIPF